MSALSVPPILSRLCILFARLLDLRLDFAGLGLDDGEIEQQLGFGRD